MIGIKDQCFGVEIELTGITRAEAAEALATYFETTPQRSYDNYDSWYVPDREGKQWRIMSDGSIRAEWNDDGHYRRTTDPEYRVEMVTPNINLDQMQYRCPDATVYGQAVLDNYDLRFRGSGVATVEPKEGACVYGLLWELTDKCEASLDRYEGYPRLYIKQTLEVRTFDGQRVPAMAYIMNPELHLKPSLPPRDYYLGIKAGYEQNGLPVGCLKYAFKNCLKECGMEPYPKKVQTKPPQRKETGYER